MKFIYPFHNAIRRHLSTMEQVIASAGLAAALYGLMRLIPSYPNDWGVAIIGAVFFISILSPVAGYFLAILAAAYPLYLVSIYVAVIFLAIAVLGQHAFIQNLGGALLTLASPLLGAIYLSWTIPLLGGLWWGPTGGAIMGGIAAFWVALVAGMAELPPDSLAMLGILPVLNNLPAHFASANSTDIFRILFQPFAPNSSALLYHILQIGSWTFIGWMVGMLNEKDWAQAKCPKAGIVLAGVGALALALLLVLLSLWIGVAITNEIWIALGLTALFSFIAASVLEVAQDFFEHPLPLSKSSTPIQFEMEDPSAPVPMFVPPLPPMTEDEETKDLIMLELD